MKFYVKRLMPILLILSSATAVIAQTREPIVIARNSNQSNIENIVSGEIFSEFSLPSILGKTKDIQGNDCLGFVGDQPNYLLNLESGFNELNLVISSNGDTTMAVEAPGGSLYCGDDTTASNQDASLNLTNLPSGEYKVWIGAFDEGNDLNYSLEINAN